MKENSSSDNKLEINNLKRIAKGYYQKGKYNQALKQFNKLLSIAKEKEDKDSMGLAYHTMGNIHFMKKEGDKAIDLYQQAHEIYTENKQEKLQADVKNNIANVYFFQDNYQKAKEYYEQALEQYKANGDDVAISNPLKYIALINTYEKNYEEAIKLFTEAVDTFQKMNDKTGLADSYSNLSSIYLQKGDLNKAMEFNEKAMDIYKDSENKVGLALSTANRGTLYFYKGESEEANKQYNTALIHFKEQSHKHGEAYVMFCLGTLFYDNGDFDKSKQYYDYSLKMKISMGDEMNFGYELAYLASMYAITGAYKEALETSLTHFKNIEKIEEDVRQGRTHLATAITLAKIKDEEIKGEIEEILNSISNITKLEKSPVAYFEKAIDKAEKENFWETLFPAKREYAQYLLTIGEEKKAISILQSARSKAEEIPMQKQVERIDELCNKYNISL